MTRKQQALLHELESLPKGYISRKVIRGREVFYHQWKENGKVKSKYLKHDEVDGFREQIRRRHAIQEMLLKEGVPVGESSSSNGEAGFETGVKTGAALRAFAKGVEKWERRDALNDILKYVRGDTIDRVMIVYGLRRTGKTTMLRQSICDLSEAEFDKAAYVKMSPTNEMAELGRDMDRLQRSGYKYVFIDEVTLMRDFVSDAALLSDIYAGMGMKVVLSGTDSLCFWLSLKDELYDRAFLLHTTFIPFREHSRLLKIDDVDDYIKYGGTLRMGEHDFDDPAAFAADASFRDDETTRRYIDTAIASNIQHSLAFTDDGRYFGKLRELYDAGELTNAVNRIVEDMNHRFLVEVVTRNFVSHDLGSAAQLLRREQKAELRNRILEAVNKVSVTRQLMDALSIVDAPGQTVKVEPEHVNQIEAYLKALDLIMTCPIESADPEQTTTDRILFTQPGMRFAQAQALIHALGKDRVFRTETERERMRICEKIESDVMGRMLEDIVLAETIRAIPYRRDKYRQLRVFKLLFPRGEFDMVVCDPEKSACRLYEIKHTAERDDGQLRRLVDPKKLAYAERNYGDILSRTVLYRGEDFTHSSGVEYRNVGEWLKSISSAGSSANGLTCLGVGRRFVRKNADGPHDMASIRESIAAGRKMS